MYKTMRRDLGFYALVACLSLLLSLWSLQKTWVMNPDGICYLAAADAVLKQGVHAARHVCNQASWPFYSILIAGTVKLLHVSLSVAANSLNSFFSLLSVLFFVAIIRQLSHEKIIHWLGVLTILSAHVFNTLRPDVIRDHGYWAFYLLSINLLFIFVKKKKIVPQLFLGGCWSVTLIVATLFRIEGGIFLLALPFFMFFLPGRLMRQRAQAFLALSATNLLIIACIAAVLMVHPHASLGRLNEIMVQMSTGPMMLLARFNATANQLAQHVLSVYAQHDAGWVLFLMLAGWYLLIHITTLTVVVSGLILYAWINKITDWMAEQRLVIYAYIALNVLVTFLFLVEQLFLSKRYVIALCLTLMLWVPFALANLIRRWKNNRRLLWLLAIAFFTVSIGGIIQFGPNKKYLRDAGDWVNQHAMHPAKIYSNDMQLRYYAGDFVFEQPGLDVLLKQQTWKNYDWLAIVVEQNNVQSVLNQMPLQPIKIIEDSRRHNQVFIYHIKS